MGRPEQKSNTPRLIAWEVTRFCLLSCKHCRGAARSSAYEGELSTDECYRLLDNIASFARPIIILTGGEPMLRPDVYEIASYAHRLELPVVMAPCGVLLSDETTARILECGIHRISVSLDGASAATHDAFRGVSGAFEGCLKGLEAARRAGLDFQINTTVSRHNVAELPAILELTARLGASVFNPFLLVPTGRGKEIADQEISPQQYEETLNWLASEQGRTDIQIRVTCAPHYQRVLRQKGLAGGPGRPVAGGCMGGKSFAFISHRGKVQICGFLDVECGDVRHEGYDFRKIWDTSEVFRRVRDVDSYHGRCGYCEFRKVCGGCRARAYALTGDYMDEEPYCVYEPRRAGAGAEPDAAGDLDALDRKLISVIQADLPVCRRPFDALAQRLGADAEQVIGRVRRLRADGLIRRIGPVFDSARLGYVSTLVAARVPAERLVEVAALVTRLPGVTHNYRRLNAYNLWFTLTAGSVGELEGTLDDLRQQTGIRDFYSLPALAIYKTRVVFSLSDEAPVPPAPHPGWVGDARGLDEGQKGLVRLIQDDLPVVPEPFAELARRLGWPTQRVLDQISEWLAAGVIRRFGAVVAHRRLGFQGNGMAVFRVPPERVDEAGRALARYPQVSHCYRRPPLPEWDYNLFAMVHGPAADDVGPLVARMAAELDVPDYDILFSTVEYKKTSMKYFCEGVRAPSRPE